MGTGVSASIGFVGTINASEWGVLMRPAMQEGVYGCAPSRGGGTRQVVVASGEVYVANTRHVVSGATFNLAENTSGQARIDMIVLDCNWSTPDAALAVVQGTPAANPQPPVLTRTAGTRWQVPIAGVRVASGQSVLNEDDVWSTAPRLHAAVSYNDDAEAEGFLRTLSAADQPMRIIRGRGVGSVVEVGNGSTWETVVPRIEAASASSSYSAGATSVTRTVTFSPPFDSINTVVACGDDGNWNVVVQPGFTTAGFTMAARRVFGTSAGTLFWRYIAIGK